MRLPFMMRLLVALLGCLPWLVQAGPAEEFAAANRSRQAALLQAWAADPETQASAR